MSVTAGNSFVWSRKKLNREQQECISTDKDQPETGEIITLDINVRTKHTADVFKLLDRSQKDPRGLPLENLKSTLYFESSDPSHITLQKTDPAIFSVGNRNKTEKYKSGFRTQCLTCLI